MTTYRIPFNRSALLGQEQEYIRQAMASGQIAGDQAFTRRCQQFLEGLLGIPKVLLTPSCTHALELAALLLRLNPGDEVLLPSFTFVSTANAFLLRGARPVFVDCRPDTLNLDTSRLESLITPRTRAIVAVHYAGVPCAMEPLLAIAQRHRLPLIEDNAHGLFGSHRGKPLGTFGSLATLSFHETKNVTCGEGGALLINDPDLIDRAEILREKGTNRARFFRGQVDRYTWIDLGSSYLMSDVLAAFLFGQLECRRHIQQTRQRLWERYARELAPWAESQHVRLPFIPPDCTQAYHMFYLLLPTLEARTALIAHLRSRGILAVFHYQPLHLSPMGRQFGGRVGDCPVTENIAERLLRLPFYNTLSEGEQSDVIAAVNEFRC